MHCGRRAVRALCVHGITPMPIRKAMTEAKPHATAPAVTLDDLHERAQGLLQRRDQLAGYL